MVDSLPPSGTDPDNQTISTNSNSKLEVIESTAYLGNFAQDSGDWTGIDEVSNGIAKVNIEGYQTEVPSVTADLTDIDALTFRIDPTYKARIHIKFDGVKEGEIDDVGDFQTLKISGLDDYGANTTVEIDAYADGGATTVRIDYIRTDPIEPESRKIELVDAGGL
jgi:hypothetical protein